MARSLLSIHECAFVRTTGASRCESNQTLGCEIATPATERVLDRCDPWVPWPTGARLSVSPNRDHNRTGSQTGKAECD